MAGAVGAVTAENLAATEQMAAGSRQVQAAVARVEAIKIVHGFGALFGPRVFVSPQNRDIL
jgi:hypothetical protein